MNQVISTPIENNAAEAGKLFAVSELDAARSLELFARSLGMNPDYATWVASRTEWVNGYTEAKPQAKGNSADQAFARYARRLNESFGIVAPKATNEAAIKKAAERAKKAEALAQRFEGYTDSQITGMLRTAYEEQAKNPTKKSALLKELETIAKQRSKQAEAEQRDELKAARTRLFDLAKQCTDLDRIQAAADVLDELNYDVTIDNQ